MDNSNLNSLKEALYSNTDKTADCDIIEEHIKRYRDDMYLYQNEAIFSNDLDSTIKNMQIYENQLMCGYDGPTEINFSSTYNHITNLTINRIDGSLTIDGVIVTPQGIFVIELIKNYGLFIIDSWGNLKHFENGWKGYQNMIDITHTKTDILCHELQKLGIDAGVITPIVVTVTDSTTVVNDHPNIHLTSLGELKNCIRNIDSGYRYNTNEMKDICSALFRIMYKADIKSIPKIIEALNNTMDIKEMAEGLL